MAAVIHNEMLDEILAQVRPLLGKGKVADYIPALASVSGNKLGIAICTIDGQRYQAGDATERFSIQSISKVLSLVAAMRQYEEEEIWQRVGKDPSGQPFNSLLQLEIEQGKPRNPFINAGRWWSAICCKVVSARHASACLKLFASSQALTILLMIQWSPVRSSSTLRVTPPLPG